MRDSQGYRGGGTRDQPRPIRKRKKTKKDSLQGLSEVIGGDSRFFLRSNSVHSKK